jgi:hypothetical protein
MHDVEMLLSLATKVRFAFRKSACENPCLRKFQLKMHKITWWWQLQNYIEIKSSNTSEISFVFTEILVHVPEN